MSPISARSISLDSTFKWLKSTERSKTISRGIRLQNHIKKLLLRALDYKDACADLYGLMSYIGGGFGAGQLRHRRLLRERPARVLPHINYFYLPVAGYLRPY